MSGRFAGRRVLVVEDEVLVAMLVEDILADHGAEAVGPATRIGAALALAQSEPLDAAILDVNLAGEVTAPVAAALAARGVPFLFATGYGRAGLPPGHEDAAVLAKPFAERDLVAALAALLSPAEAR